MMKILVIGGSGYIGSGIVSKLKDYHEITVLSRNPDQTEGVKTLKGSLTDKSFLFENIKNYDLVINLAAIIRTSIKSKYKDNVEGTKNLIEAMEKNKVKKLIFFSTHSVYNKEVGHYGTSKKLCEKLVRNSSLEYIILRPNYVYGIDKQNDIYTLINMIKRLKIAPIIGNGNTKIQPINKEDIANITLKLVKNFKPNTTYDISGSKQISFNEIINFTKEQLNKKCFKLKIPLLPLKLLKSIVPFDVEGFTEDRLSDKEKFKLKHDIYEDLKEIIKLK